ncbi:hypothetical protein [Bacillus nitroreducens]
MTEQITVVKDWDKLSLVKRVQELEKRGYSCVAPIASIKKTTKLFKYRKADYQAYKNDFLGTEDHVLYIVKMVRKVSA